MAPLSYDHYQYYDTTAKHGIVPLLIYNHTSYVMVTTTANTIIMARVAITDQHYMVTVLWHQQLRS